MHASLLEKWHPVTDDFGLIQAPLPLLLSTFEEWHNSIGIRYSRTEISSSLSDALESLLPLSHSKMRRLFVATRSDWVACFQNGIQGSDPFPAMSELATRMGVLAMRVCCTPERAMYPAVIWDLYAPEARGGCPPLGYRRHIAAQDDDGWVFEESGERFPFEEVERYTLRRKRDRFTREMLARYLHHFGIELFTDDFLCVDATTPAVRLQQVTKVIRSMPEYTLDQVVAGLPWRRG